MFKLDETISFQNKKNDVLTVGELLVDMISTNYVEDKDNITYRPYFGGSPSNIAMNIKRLGINSIVVSAVGNDRLGTFLVNHLKEANMSTDHIQTGDNSTSMVLVNKSKNSPVPIFYRGADFHIKITPELENILLNSKVLHFSCWPISKNPSRHTIEKMVDIAKNNNVLVCFDPNYHPMIWEEGENGTEYVKSFIKKADIVKPSEDDAERLFGKDTPKKQIEKFLSLGANLVIMTLGEEGAIVSNGKELVKFDTLATEVIDTTGAGDAFWSGFYTGIVKNYTIKEALACGFAVCAYKLKYTGAVVGLPKLEVIKAMYNL